ncbi:hypothetical protein G9A89_016759 [Geosiphon pyriformis]|nr:hypothetical protein G9A89_016759 [Geosiphon pyriformis]
MLSYLKRHLRGIAITAGITGGVYILGKYAKWKIEEFKDKVGAERTAKENMKRRFLQRQNDCTYVVLPLLSSIGEQLWSEIDIESIIGKLQRAKGNQSSTPTTSPSSSGVLVKHKDHQITDVPVEGEKKAESEVGYESSDQNSSQTPPLLSKKEKLKLWNEVKIKSLTRTISSIYLLTFLTILTHVQLNLLGRFNYLYSVLSLTERDKETTIQIQPAKGIVLSPDNEKNYLFFTWWLLNVGWKRVVERVNIVVERIVTDIPINRELSYKDFVWLISEIRGQIDGSDDIEGESMLQGFRNVMLPETLSEELDVLRQVGEDEPIIDGELRKLLDETKDFLDSPDFKVVQSACLTAGFDLFQNDMYPHFILLENDEENIQPPGKIINLAMLLPDLSKQAHVIINGVPNRYLEAVKNVKEFQEFTAIIYSSFDDVL